MVAAAFAAAEVEPQAKKPEKPKPLTLAFVRDEVGLEKMTVRAIDPKWFIQPEYDDRIQDLRVKMSTRVLPKQGPVYQIADTGNREEIKDMVTCFEYLDDHVRGELGTLLNMYRIGQFAERFSRLRLIARRINGFEYAAGILAIDKACASFCKYVDEMERDMNADVTALELLMLSGLDKYCSSSGTTIPEWDRNLRTLDMYLVKIDKETLESLNKNTFELMAKCAECRKAIAEARSVLAKVEHYQKISQIVDGYDKMIVAIEELANEALATIREADNSSSDICKLRRLRELTPNRFMMEAGYLPTDCKPVYTRRVRVALRECKRRFNKAAEKINERHRGEYGYHDVEWR